MELIGKGEVLLSGAFWGLFGKWGRVLPLYACAREWIFLMERNQRVDFEMSRARGSRNAIGESQMS